MTVSPVPSSSSGTPGQPTETSAWEPLRNRIFRVLWIASFVANIGTWMQTVGAQWFLLDHHSSSAVVAFVQAAASLPVLLLTLPAGVLAEFVDRRRLLLAVQAFQAVTGGLLAAVTLTGHMTPDLLLAFTFLLGAGAAVQLPAYQAFIPALVPRSQLGAAASLSSLGVNLARAIGPAIAGVLVTSLGTGGLFVLNAASFVVFAVALVTTPGPAGLRQRSAGFLAGLEAGGRYVRNAPAVRRILLRLVVFAAPANILWALLPLVARHQLGLGAAGYGILLAAAGVGAVVGAVAAPWIRARFSPTALLTVSGLVYGAGMLVLGLTHTPAVAVVVLLPTGVAWIIVIAGLNAAVQSFLPAWVRARALSIYQVVLFTTFAVSAIAWGIVAQETSLAAAFYLAGALLIVGAVAGLRWPLRPSTLSQRAQVTFWPEPAAPAAGEELTEPVEVIIGYTVDPGQRAAFLAAMAGLRRSRLRTGAFRWELYQDPADPSRYSEQFEVGSWQDHLEQHHDRLTADDRDFQQLVANTARAVEPARHLTRQEVGADVPAGAAPRSEEPGH
jgi:MFS family permease